MDCGDLAPVWNLAVEPAELPARHIAALHGVLSVHDSPAKRDKTVSFLVKWQVSFDIAPPSIASALACLDRTSGFSTLLWQGDRNRAAAIDLIGRNAVKAKRVH